MTERRLRLGRIELRLAMHEPLAAQLRQHPVYRLIRPILNPTRKQPTAKAKALATLDPSPAQQAQARGAQAITIDSLRNREPQSQEEADVLREVLSVEWYHTMDLGHGIATPGEFDHRSIIPILGLPEDMRGLRALDVATLDGFWAFEMERRGAEVVALDIDSFAEWDWAPLALKAGLIAADELGRQTGAAFRIAKRLLGSKVDRTILNVYDLCPERLGTFDVVFCGDLLLHLLNPVKAVQNIYGVCRGVAYFMEPFDPILEQFGARKVMRYFGGRFECFWWLPSLSCLRQIVVDAGFKEAEVTARFQLEDRSDSAVLWRAAIKASVQ